MWLCIMRSYKWYHKYFFESWGKISIVSGSPRCYFSVNDVWFCCILARISHHYVTIFSYPLQAILGNPIFGVYVAFLLLLITNKFVCVAVLSTFILETSCWSEPPFPKIEVNIWSGPRPHTYEFRQSLLNP